MNHATFQCPASAVIPKNGTEQLGQFQEWFNENFLMVFRLGKLNSLKKVETAFGTKGLKMWRLSKNALLKLELNLISKLRTDFSGLTMINRLYVRFLQLSVLEIVW